MKTYWLYRYNRETGDIQDIEDKIPHLDWAISALGSFLDTNSVKPEECLHIVDNTTSNTVWHAGKDILH